MTPRTRPLRVSVICFLPATAFFVLATCTAALAAQRAMHVVKRVVTLRSPGTVDQDDMCFWKHPKDPAKSVVITADKYGDQVSVYDLKGIVLQVIKTRFPGNIDSRKGFTFAGKKIDIVVFNQRGPFRIKIYKIDPATRKLTCIDKDDIATRTNYGGTLYHSRKLDKFYFFTTSKHRHFEQHELFDDGKGRITKKTVRSWKVGYAEAAVADDAAGTVFVGEERRGVWVFGAEASDPTTGKLIARVGQNGLRADVEGLTILPTGEKSGYLIVSSQGNHTFKVYDRKPPYAFIGTFNVARSVSTDGIDVIGGNFGDAFPEGIFACHSGRNKARCAVLLSSWKDIAAGLKKQ